MPRRAFGLLSCGPGDTCHGIVDQQGRQEFAVEVSRHDASADGGLVPERARLLPPRGLADDVRNNRAVRELLERYGRADRCRLAVELVDLVEAKVLQVYHLDGPRARGCLRLCPAAHKDGVLVGKTRQGPFDGGRALIGADDRHEPTLSCGRPRSKGQRPR